MSSGRALGTLPEFFADALPRYSWTIDSVFIDETWAKTNMIRTHGWDREDSACADKRRTGIGKRSHSLRPCGHDPDRRALRP